MANAMGICEVVEDEAIPSRGPKACFGACKFRLQIKRVGPQHVHLQSGRKLEAAHIRINIMTCLVACGILMKAIQAQVILKLYGFNGNFDVDRLMTLA